MKEILKNNNCIFMKTDLSISSFGAANVIYLDAFQLRTIVKSRFEKLRLCSLLFFFSSVIQYCFLISLSCELGIVASGRQSTD